MLNIKGAMMTQFFQLNNFLLFSTFMCVKVYINPFLVVYSFKVNIIHINVYI